MFQLDYELGKCFICNDYSGSSQACSSCMRKLTLNETHIPMEPKSYSEEDNDSCAYCQTITSFIEGRIDLGIRYCISHKSQAQTDMKTWLIANDCVFMKDVKSLYPELYRILENGIPLRRSTGSFDNDWKLDKTKGIMKKDKIVGWSITFCKFNIVNQSFFANKIIKRIPISIFIDDPSYSIFFRSMMKRFKKNLDKGFYISD